FVALQREVEAINADVTHLHFFAQQRQYTHRKTQHAQLGEGLLRCLRTGQGGLVQFQAQPGEQAPADVTVEGQFQVGFVACQLTNFVLVVVGIEPVGEGETQTDQDQQEPKENNAQ